MRWTLRLALPLAALAAAELGHLLALGLRFGPDALRLDGGGHGYLPALSAVLGGVAGVLTITALFVIAVARGLGSTRRPMSAGAVLNLASALLIGQLAIYSVQELAEAIAGHAPLPGAADLIFWGVLGQLPAALLAAAVVAPLLAEVEAALDFLIPLFARLRTLTCLLGVRPVQCGLTPRRSGSIRLLTSSLRGPPLSL